MWLAFRIFPKFLNMYMRKNAILPLTKDVRRRFVFIYGSFFFRDQEIFELDLQKRKIESTEKKTEAVKNKVEPTKKIWS